MFVKVSEQYISPPLELCQVEGRREGVDVLPVFLEVQLVFGYPSDLWES